jgi:signal transduction histidine kinase
MEFFRGRAWPAAVSVGVLAVLCGGLAVLQYRWIGEISAGERSQLRQQLEARLNELSRAFNDQISAACAALEPSPLQVEQEGLEKAYSEKYLLFRESSEPLFRRIALLPDPDAQDLLILDQKTGRFVPAEWPAEWAAVRERLAARRGGGPPEPAPESPNVIEWPRFQGPGGQPGPRRRERLLLEPDLEYLGRIVIPAYVNRFVGSEYDAEVLAGTTGAIYTSSPGLSLESSADASVPLLNLRPAAFGFRGGRGFRGLRDRNPNGRGPGGPPEPGQGRWVLLVRHRAGSLDALVAQTRVRNLAVSAGILLLIVATTATLVRVSRRAQQLAELQMSFVANVSHELRTPLTVIRTAAFNLRGKLASRPDQVERYGSLIEAESEKLEKLVEQVLRFSSAAAGHAIRDREPVAVENLIEEGLKSSRAALSGPGWEIECRIDPGLPLVLADEVALRHALQNLVDNAVKYGTGGSKWIGVSASSVSGGDGPAVEIRVADHGPGIPPDEQAHIFDPFFRGRRALQDQVHGTGLGLNLVKRIVEAHGGTIRVISQPSEGAEFIVRIPAAPPELQDEFAHTAG